MAILDIFKKKTTTHPPPSLPKAKVPKKPVKKLKPEKKPKEVKIEKPSKIVTPRVKKEVKIGEAYRILKAPQITEKATALAGNRQYTFKVWPGANKVEIKKAIGNLYGVDVMSVKIIKVPPKQRRLGRISGWTKAYKKAIVKIKEGQKIEVLPR